MNHRLWTRILDRYTMPGLPKSVVSTMSGAPPQTTQDRTQRTHIGMGSDLDEMVNERFRASFLHMRHVADIMHHFVSECTTELRTEGIRGNARPSLLIHSVLQEQS